MKRSSQHLHHLLGIITLDQLYTTLSLPIITLIFFDKSSSLFSPDTPNAIRSMWYGTCVATPYLVNLFFAPLISALSDEVGRRKTLLFELTSAFFYTLVAGVGVLYGSLSLVITSFVIRGAFSRTNTTALSIIGDTCDRHSKLRYMSYLQVAISAGACAGPIIGGLIGGNFFFNNLNYSMVFFIAASGALLNIMLSNYLIQETLTENHSSTMSDRVHSRIGANLQGIRYVVMHPDVLKISLILLLLQISWSAYYQFIPPVLKTAYHFDAHMLGIFMGMIGLWLIIGSGPLLKLMHTRFDTHSILNIGACMVMAGYSLTIACYYHFIQGMWALWVSASLIPIGDVLTYICLTTLYSNVVPGHMQGKVTGVNFLIIGLIWGSVSFIGGLLISYSIILPILIAPAGVIASLFAINSINGKNMIALNSA